MKSFEHTIMTKAQASTIWELYSDITTWTLWDKGFAHASLEGPFVQGTRGVLQPQGQDRLGFILTEVIPGEGFSDVTDIPNAGIQVHFNHKLEKLSEGTAITHQVTVTGANADTIGVQFVQRLSVGIPHTMAGLAGFALEREGQ